MTEQAGAEANVPWNKEVKPAAVGMSAAVNRRVGGRNDGTRLPICLRTRSLTAIGPLPGA